MSQVLGYGDLVKAIADETGIARAQVEKVLLAAQKNVISHIAAKEGNRVRFGRLCTFYSKMTKERLVNNPQAPGEQVTSPAHMVGRVQMGKVAMEVLAGGEWR